MFMNDGNHDKVFESFQGTIDTFLKGLENRKLLDKTVNDMFTEEITKITQNWDDYCASHGVVGQPLKLYLGGRRGMSATQPATPQPAPEPVRNPRREAILAQRARKVA